MKAVVYGNLDVRIDSDSAGAHEERNFGAENRSGPKTASCS